MRKVATNIFGFANHLALIVCFISYEKWVAKRKFHLRCVSLSGDHTMWLTIHLFSLRDFVLTRTISRKSLHILRK